MIRSLMLATSFLSRPSERATESDLQIAQDMRDTLTAHKDECVGMAANMIGALKRIIIFEDEKTNTQRVMFNPKMTKCSGAYQTQEACLCLEGMRPATRYKRITVRYQDEQMVWHTETFTEWTAQIIQHELDHLEGVLI